MAQSNWVFDDNEDEDSNIINFSTTLMFDLEEDQADAMQDFAFCTTEEGDYVSDDNKPSGVFNPINSYNAFYQKSLKHNPGKRGKKEKTLICLAYANKVCSSVAMMLS